MLQVALKLLSPLLERLGILIRWLVEVGTVSSSIIISEMVGLIRGRRVINTRSLPWVVTEVAVEDVVHGPGRGTAEFPYQRLYCREHLVAEDLLALFKVILQVYAIGANRAFYGSGIEPSDLEACLPAPTATIGVPSRFIGK